MSINPADPPARGRLECGCPGPALSRRRFLQGLAAVAGTGIVTATSGSTFIQAALASTPDARPNVLVVLSMRGGADGLSLVVPCNDPAYETARPTIGIPTSSLLVRDETFGLHPMLEPLVPMWKDGSFAAVHAVGLPQPNRSHFAAMEEIEDADPGSDERRGWLNRLVGLDRQSEPVEGVQLGSALVPASLYGPEPVLAVADIDDMFLPGRRSAEAYERRVASLRAAWDGVPGALGRGARAALDVSIEFEDLAGRDDEPLHGAEYPSGDLGAALAGTARLIRSGIGAEVITVDSGDWDMHVGMGTVDRGRLADNAAELARSISAFFQDLGPDGDQVTLVTISEFGRRVTENASRGLDHGWGNVMLLLGAGVKGGRYHARWPGLGDAALVDGDLAVTTDFRSVLSEVVTSRFDVDAGKVFPGFQPDPLGVMR